MTKTNALDKLLKSLEKHGELSELGKNEHVIEFLKVSEKTFTDQALLLAPNVSNEDRFQALIARDVIKRIGRMLSRANYDKKRTEEQIEQIQNQPEKEDI